MLFIYQNLLQSYELSVNPIFAICTQVTWENGEAITIYSVELTENSGGSRNMWMGGRDFRRGV